MPVATRVAPPVMFNWLVEARVPVFVRTPLARLNDAAVELPLMATAPVVVRVVARSEPEIRDPSLRRAVVVVRVPGPARVPPLEI